MATQHKTNLHNNIYTINPQSLGSDPLRLDELLNLIALANEFGYTVKSAHDKKSGDNPVLAEIYSIWFAIENELLIFAHNVPWLIGLSSMKYAGHSMQGH
jgi:hypothetical protein